MQTSDLEYQTPFTGACIRLLNNPKPIQLGGLSTGSRGNHAKRQERLGLFSSSIKHDKSIKEQIQALSKHSPRDPALHLALNRLAVELDFPYLAFGEHVAMLLTPLHKCELDSLITVNCNKVAVFISVT